MRKAAVWILALGFMAAPAASAFAGVEDNKPANSDSSKSTDSTKSTDSAKAPAPAGDASKTAAPATNGATPSSAELASEIEQLRTLLRQQADQLERQQREMAEMKANLDRVSTAANSAAPATVGNTAPAGVPSTVAPGTSGAVASASPASVPAVGAPQGGDQHSPLFFKIGDASFTPGGFMDFTAVYRTEATGNGIGTTFNGIPYINAAAGASGPVGYGETRFSVQNSRVALRVDAPVGEGKIAGYVEADFLGLIAANANVTSNSDSLRMRLYFGDYRRGPWEVMGGQDWSMLTPNRKGIGVFPGDIFFTQNMDTNYQIGLTWKRTPQFRVIYHANDSWTLGVSVENPDALLTTAVTVPTLFTPVNGQVDLTSGGTLATPTTPGFIPDFIFKAAYDGKVGEKAMHVEAAGLLRGFKLFTPASVTAAGNQTRTALGAGGSLNFNLELLKNFHLIASTFWSDGGGVYIIGSGPDIVVRQATTTSPFVPSPVHAYSGVGGFEWQATKNSFLDAYYGGAYYARNFSVNPSAPAGPPVGYGFAGSAVTNNRSIQEGTLGWTQTFWSSPNYGKFSLITQGSYLSRNPWFAAVGAPRDAHMFIVYADLRYTLP